MESTNLATCFWRHVSKKDGCWSWTGAIDTHGYGHIKNGYILRRAHRISWQLHYGPIPVGLCVCHHCDNRSCVNPEHLFLGTNADNTHDAAKKERLASKLKARDVQEIRQLLSSGKMLHREIGAKFSISRVHVTDIANSKKWKYL